ncbi:MAG TPA: methyltransferase domain-containing protein [Bacillota bacterium]
MDPEAAALVEHVIPLPGRRLRVRAYASVDALLDRVTGDDDIPFWAELWASSRALAGWLWHRDLLHGLRVLELGCGVGLAGIAAALRGARVLQTDRAPEALILARENARRNGCPSIERRLADWRRFPDLGRFDLVLGADILYEPRLHADLIDVLARHLEPGGRAVLADPGRRGAECFLAAAERSGWRWDLEEWPAGGGNRGDEPMIDILVLSPPDPGTGVDGPGWEERR